MMWEMVKLGDICEINMGKTPPRDKAKYWGGSNSWVAISDLKGDIFISKTKECITDIALKESGIKPVAKGTLLYSFKLSIGKVAITEKVLYTNEAIVALPVKDSTKLDTKYLYYAIQQVDLTGIGDKAVKGITLNKEKLKILEIPLPPLSIQQKIAAILDKADALRRKDQALLKKYDDLAQAIFIDMFGDPVKNEMGWEVRRLDECLEKGEKISYGVVQPGDFFQNGIPIVRISDFKSMKIDISNLKTIDPEIEKTYKKTRLVGDEILIACVGFTIGKIALADSSLKGFNIVRATTKVRVDKSILNRVYLAFQLSQSSIQNYFLSEIRTSAQPTLNVKQIQETKVLTPPIELQNQFEKASINLLNQMELVEKSNSENLFQSLLQQAFKGELV